MTTTTTPWQTEVHITCTCGRLDTTVTGQANARRIATGHDRAYHAGRPTATVPTPRR